MWRLLKRGWVAQQRRHDDYKANATPEQRAKRTVAFAVLFPPLWILFPLMFVFRALQWAVRFAFTRPAAR